MGWRLDNKLKIESPAPGAYDLIHSIDRDRSQSWKGMHLSLRPDISRSTTNHVGPGEYDVTVPPRSEFGSMGKSERQYYPTTKNVID